MDRIPADAPLTALKGIGKKTAEQLDKLGLRTVGELLRYYPLRYEAFDAPSPVRTVQPGSVVTVRGYFKGPLSGRYVSGRHLTTGSLQDETGTLRVSWFNMPYIKSSIRADAEQVLRGSITGKGSARQLLQPRVYTPEEYELLAQTLQPVYALTAGLSRKKLQKAVAQALSEAELPPELLPDYLTDPDWPPPTEALRQIHFPQNEAALTAARSRLIFEEFFCFVLRIRLLKQTEEAEPNRAPMLRTARAEQLKKSLPYALTGAQERVWQELRRDLAGPHPMNRLIQGDVGSGKTVLALLALVTAWENGYQGALMAPTEVLAHQHYTKLSQMLAAAGLPVRVEYLAGSLRDSEKKAARARIAAGEADLVIGTHALVQTSVSFRRLGLVITDEQHRFGVRQRDTLGAKGERPHTLVMSATPIPRTLAIVMYGDLSVSAVDELPAGRIPVQNSIIRPAQREKAWGYILDQLRRGRQAYIICPLVEESEALPGEDVLSYAEQLRQAFPPELRVEALHGRMRPEEKDRIMAAFAAGKIHVLVSTTVVEVGVDVPNASVILVENAERFGLAQLHQLRGRVGRGTHPSYAVFVDGSGQEEENPRLAVMKRSNDGFQIAEEDLRLRGPGDLFGVRQSGILDFQLGDIYNNHDLLLRAAAAVDSVLSEDPSLSLEKNHMLRHYLS